MRALCADTLETHADDFKAFCEYTPETPDFESYCATVRSSDETWGGHLELRALAVALNRPVHVYRADSDVLVLGEGEATATATAEPIRLSYHLHYYSLGEHYNQVVVVEDDDDDDDDQL